jgi:hypothetical protein
MQGKTGTRESYEFAETLLRVLTSSAPRNHLRRHDASVVMADALEVDGRVYRRVLRSQQTYAGVAPSRWSVASNLTGSR